MATTSNDNEDGTGDKIVTFENHVQNPAKRSSSFCGVLNITTRMDGGYSWIVCAVGFLIQCIVAAQGNISGIIFAALLDEYNSNRSQTGKPFCLIFVTACSTKTAEVHKNRLLIQPGAFCSLASVRNCKYSD